MTFTNILVALDQSSSAEAVFHQALELVHDRSSLLIFHAMQVDVPGQTGPFLGIGTLADVDVYSSLKHDQREQIQKDIDEAEAWLNGYGRRAQAKGIQPECVCKVGEPGSWICDLANNWKADLIVIGRRGRTGLAEIVLGSVSNHVVHQAPCSVLVVQGH
ncbi:MAG: universal stress protein [Elainellaceae cyanobacterium]